MKKISRLFGFSTCLAILVSSGGIANAEAIDEKIDNPSVVTSADANHNWKLVDQGENYLLFEIDRLPAKNLVCTNTNVTTFAIGDTYPQFPGGRVCDETFIYKTQANTLLKQATGVNGIDLVARYGASQAVAAIIKVMTSSNLIGAIASLLGLGLSYAKAKTESWWAQQLLSVATGQKRYIRKQIICNYGGGYPAAWTRVDVY